MGALERDLLGAVGVVIVLVALIGFVAVTLGRPAPRSTVAALETIAWLVVVMAVGGLLVLVAVRA